MPWNKTDQIYIINVINILWEKFWMQKSISVTKHMELIHPWK